MTDVAEVKTKLKDLFSLDNILENIPMLIGFGVGIYALDKAMDIAGKIKPLTAGVRKLNKSEIFEVIDTIGDNAQLIELVLKQFKIDIGDFDVGRIADFMQNLSAAGKLISGLIDTVKQKGGISFSRGKTGSNYS